MTSSSCYQIKIDRKVCSVLTDQKSTTSCNICRAKPSQMNNLKLIRKLKCTIVAYKFGLSTLHCLFRFMECLLHISYNMYFKKGSARKEKKILKKKRKAYINE